jgi:hypothetical protein
MPPARSATLASSAAVSERAGRNGYITVTCSGAPWKATFCLPSHAATAGSASSTGTIRQVDGFSHMATCPVTAPAAFVARAAAARSTEARPVIQAAPIPPGSRGS